MVLVNLHESDDTIGVPHCADILGSNRDTSSISVEFPRHELFLLTVVINVDRRVLAHSDEPWEFVQKNHVVNLTDVLIHNLRDFEVVLNAGSEEFSVGVLNDPEVFVSGDAYDVGIQRVTADDLDFSFRVNVVIEVVIPLALVDV